MEIKIPGDIREHTETVFMGLTLRQTVFSALAVAASVTVYFALKDTVGAFLISWLSVLAAVPFAVMGFLRYHGMPAEKIIFKALMTAVMERRVILNRPVNLYYELLREGYEKGGTDCLKD